MWMLLRIKTVLKTVLLPPGGSLLLAILGLILIRRRPRLARACLILGIGSLWLLSTPLVSDALEGLTESFPPLNLTSAAGAQAVVILGGGGQVKRAPEYGGPAARPLLLERLAYGAYVARKTGLPVLVSGAQIEAAAMRETLQRNFDIPVRWVDDQAGDTFQNARNSVRILKNDGIERIVLVTHASHMVRSAREFTAAGVQVVPAPTGFASTRGHSIEGYFPSPEGLMQSYTALYEVLGEQVQAFLAFTHLRRH